MKAFLKKIKEEINALIEIAGKKTLFVIGIFVGIIFTLLMQKI